MRTLRGFTLIELLVGLAISMFALLAVGKIMLHFSQQRTTINQTIATQSNGVLALYLLEKELAQAGYGLYDLRDCGYINFYYNSTGYYNAPWNTGNLPGQNNVAITTLPVRIIDGDTGSDTVEVQYGDSTSGIPSATIWKKQDAYNETYKVKSPIGISVGDRVVAKVGTVCTMAAVTAVEDPPVSADPVSATNSYGIAHGLSDAYNVNAAPGGSGWVTVSQATVDAKTALLANLGSFKSRRYRVTTAGALAVSEFPANLVDPTATGNRLVEDIVFMKAQYGVAANNTSTAVDRWKKGPKADGSIDATENTDRQMRFTTLAEAQEIATRVIAVRIGIVARSPLVEKSDVDAPATLSVLPPVSGSVGTSEPAAGTCATDATTREVRCTVPDRKYRYKVYSTIIPLKNAIWAR